jgi:adenylate cyclase
MKNPSLNVKRDLARLLAGSPAGLLAFLILLFFSFVRFGALDLRLTNRLEGITGDLFRKTLAKPLREDIEVVFLDDISLKEAESKFGVTYPWQREIYASAVDFLKAAGAKAVVFDFLFTSASSWGPKDDQTLASASTRQGCVIIGMEPSKSDQPDVLKAFLAQPPLYRLPLKNGGALYQAKGGDFPKPPLWGGVAGVGDVTFASEDGVCRQIIPAMNVGGAVMPALSLSAFWNLTGRPAIEITPGTLKIDGQSFPLDSRGRLNLLFRKPPAATTRLYDLVVSRANLAEKMKPLVDPARFKGKIVLIGTSAPGLMDLRMTPINRQSPGVLVHASAMDNFLSGTFLKVVEMGPLGWLSILVACMLISIFAFRIPGVAMPLIPLGLTVAWITLCALFYSRSALLLPSGLPLAAIWVSAAFSASEYYLLEKRRRSTIQTAFGQFLSPAVFSQLMADRQPLKTGGEKHELTVFFSDLQGFTTFSEKMDPHDLVEVLNFYLTEMGEVVAGQCEGYVDKYEGDAIMAFWGAPLPNTGHALSGARAAWRCQLRLKQIQPALAKMGLDTGGEGLVMRVGLNTGPAVVGLMGSTRKLNYTAMGDTVNLASRLEGANKAYTSRIMMSEATRVSAGPEAVTRELDRIRVKGKKDPTLVHELLGIKDEGEALAGPALIARWQEGMALYIKKDFTQALKSFETCLGMKPGDGPSTVYIARCKDYLESPPPEAWDGVYIMKTK